MALRPSGSRRSLPLSLFACELPTDGSQDRKGRNAIYLNITPAKNDGATIYKLNVKDVLISPQ